MQNRYVLKHHIEKDRVFYTVNKLVETIFKENPVPFAVASAKYEELKKTTHKLGTLTISRVL